tara:strand:- start:885 stop:1187 length:303 start_codon:yes stop_codon:yes gene_type:complete
MTKKKKPYFHNNWQEYKDADDCFFMDHSFEEFMDWKIHGYQIPSSVCCIIRESDPKTKKVKEYVYSKPHHAINKIHKLMDEEKEFVICDEDQIQIMYPEK